MAYPSSIKLKIERRKQEGLYRELQTYQSGIDFFSNDYLGFSRLEFNYNNEKFLGNGSTGSRLISGNSIIAEETEQVLADFFNAEKTLIFNSGYDANLGLLSSIGGRNDVFLMDELCHASMYDGCRLSFAKTFKFAHNNLSELKRLIQSNSHAENIFIVLESVYSMDGDYAPLEEFTQSIQGENIFFIIDEAHATGVVGEFGKGLVHKLNLQNKIFARVITFGKALGCHGACVAGSESLINYLINYARSFIYSTALPPSSYIAIRNSIKELCLTNTIPKLHENINYFLSLTREHKNWLPSYSAIQSILIKGNENAERVAQKLKEAGFLVKAIKSPTVTRGKERIRICIHAFNHKNEISSLVSNIQNLVETK